MTKSKFSLIIACAFLLWPASVGAQVAQIVFTTSPKTVDQGEISSTISVQLQNASGVMEQTSETVDVEFLSTSSTGEFLSPSSDNPVTKTISTGSANKNFRYRDSQAGVFTITVNAKGRISGNTWSVSQEVTVEGQETPSHGTLVLGRISQDTTWLESASPYILESMVFIENGATLTMEPGVVVKLSRGSFLNLNHGNIVAEGTPEKPIHFTSIHNDAVGGRVSGSSGNPSRHDYWGMNINDSTASSFVHVHVSYSYGGIFTARTNAQFKNVVISESEEGITGATGSELIVENTWIYDIDYDGIVGYDDSILFVRNTVVENVSRGNAVAMHNGSSLVANNLEVRNISRGSALALNSSRAEIDNSIFSVGADNAIMLHRDFFNNQKPSISLKNSIVENYLNIGLASYGGVTSVENTQFNNNSYSGVEIYGEDEAHVYTRNSFVNNGRYALISYNNHKVEAVNNWWGHESGPFEQSINPEGLGGEIYGNVEFAPWLILDPFDTTTPTRNPVIIIPGVMGTEIFNGDEKLWLDILRNMKDAGDQFMDPLRFSDDLQPSVPGLKVGEVIGNPANLFDYTATIISDFEALDYTLNVDLFLFPYDWRYGVSVNNVESLKQKILHIKSQTGSNKVDVVAHSTGGLLVKKYVMDNPTTNYLDKVVFVGVPNTGAPKAIKVLLQGDGFGNPFLSNAQMKKIAKNLPVVYDLAPSARYYEEKGSYVSVVNSTFASTVRTDLNFEETKNFLISDHELNSQAISNSENLHNASFDNYDLREAGIDLYNMVGCRAGTIGKVVEKRSTGLLGTTRVTYELQQTPGDGTVPLESATNLPINPANKYYALQAEHSKMMTQDGIRQQIVDIVTGSNLNMGNTKITQDVSKCKLNGRAVSIYSPLNVEVTDQYGNYSGIDEVGNIFNNIPNADLSVFGGSKFLYLPTDDGQTYTINLTGTGEGTFTLVDSDIVGDEVAGTRTFADIPVSVNLKANFDLADSILTLDHEGDGQVDTSLKGVQNAIVTMPYNFSGFLQPINDTTHHPTLPLSVFKAGSTVPVKFQLRKHDGSIVQATNPPQWLMPTKGAVMNATIGEPVYSFAETSGVTYRWDSESGQYIYNWNTKKIAPGYWYEIHAKLDDGNIYSVTVGLR
jgi:triacylglycerol esterase/lipase EstA (alpha/beta hydrolase family)